MENKKTNLLRIQTPLIQIYEVIQNVLIYFLLLIFR